MSRPRKVRPDDPVILEMRLSQIRELISRLSTFHASLGASHIGWANCECELAFVLRMYSKSIQVALGLGTEAKKS